MCELTYALLLAVEGKEAPDLVPCLGIAEECLLRTRPEQRQTGRRQVGGGVYSIFKGG